MLFLSEVSLNITFTDYCLETEDLCGNNNLSDTYLKYIVAS